MGTVASDLIVMWIGAAVFIFAVMFAAALSLQDKETEVMAYGGIGLILIGAIIVTIGQLIGWIGVW